MLLHRRYFPKLGIILPAYKGSNASVNPGIDNFFATVAYRYGHAVVTDTLLRLDENWAEHPEVRELDISATVLEFAVRLVYVCAASARAYVSHSATS